MTTTSVRDVGSVMNLGAVGNAVKTDGNSFQQVWDTQAGKGRTAEQPETKSTPKKSGKTEETTKPGDDLRAAERSTVRTEREKAAATDNLGTGKPEEMSEDDLEKAMEVIATAVADLVAQIADTFQMPVEEVQELMTDFNLQPADLLDPEKLNKLLLAAGGAQDSMSLLTDEQLYTDFQKLTEQGRATLEQTAEKLQLSPEQLDQVLAAVQENAKAEEAPEQTAEKLPGEPVIEITVQREEPETDVRPVIRDEGDAEVSAVSGTDGQEALTAPTQAAKEQEAPENKTADDRQQSKRETHEHTRPESGPTFQNIRNDNFQPRPEDIQEAGGTRETNTQDLMRQIMDYMRVQIRPDVSNLEMQLHPASLGTLQVQVASRGGVLTANFVTQNEAVKAALESQMIQLKESFEQQGVKVEAIEVTVQTHQFEENLEQGGQRQSEESGARKSRTRRINLDGVNDPSDSGDFTDADRLTAEVMAANGNTVDYTA